MLNLLVAALALAAPDSLVFHGRDGRLEATAPLHETAIEVDGRLEEPQWSGAAVLTGFSGYLPVDGRAAEDSTEVLVWLSPTALHVGIRAYEPHGAVRATLADRDRLEGEDHVQILLDTFGEGRQAYVLAVNALGVQADGIRMENKVNYEAKPGFGNVDLSPNLAFESRGRVTEWGYEVEMRIPFKSLRYARGRDAWRINAVRQVQHSGHQDTWAPVRQADPSFLARSGTLAGLGAVRSGATLELNPVFTSTTAGAASEGGWRYRTEPRAGGNLRWGITPGLTLNATYAPDFSQVEADAGQIPGDARYAIAFPERRPFFVDGTDLFDVPSRLVYTRRIVEPLAAARLSGKVGRTEVGYLAAADGAELSRSGEDHPLFHILRVRRGIGDGGSTLGALFTNRSEEAGFNRVGSLDARLLFGGTRIGLQAAGSATGGGDGRTVYAPLWSASASHNTRGWGLFQHLSGVHPDFQARSGLVDRADVVQSQSFVRLSRFSRPGALLESWNGRVIFYGTWLYDEFFESRAPLEDKLWLESGVKLRGGWNLVLTRMFERFAFDPREYAHYRVELPGASGIPDTTDFRVSSRVRTGGWYFTGSTPQFRHLSASLAGFHGLDPFFLETRATRRFDVDASVRWVPGDRLRVDASYAHSEFVREDGTRASVLDIPRLRVEYQLSRPLFLRLVAQHLSQETGALLDPRSEAPILLPDGQGGYRQAERDLRADLRLDWLVSYQPNPGTVVFVGYGSSMTAPGRLSLHDLERTRDGLFVKLSYVFRS